MSKKTPIHIRQDENLRSIDEELDAALDHLDGVNSRVGGLLTNLDGASAKNIALPEDFVATGQAALDVDDEAVEVIAETEEPGENESDSDSDSDSDDEFDSDSDDDEDDDEDDDDDDDDDGEDDEDE